MQNCVVGWLNRSDHFNLACQSRISLKENEKSLLLSKKSVAAVANIPDRTRLYAKTSHPHLRHSPRSRRTLPASCHGTAIFGADSEIQLHRCFRQKAIGRS